MVSDVAQTHQDLILDGTKIHWHQDRLDMWRKNKKFAPLTIDMALTRSCNYSCNYCYAMMQENKRYPITMPVMDSFLKDCASMGVRGISLVSDGESTLNPIMADVIVKGSEYGMSMALGTNGYLLNEEILKKIMPHLTYIRINITAGEVKRYSEIMGVPQSFFQTVCDNIKTMVRLKKVGGYKTTIGLQMVLMPEYEDQILPLAHLGKMLRPDYLVIKHCSDNEDGFLGVDYSGYEKLYDKLKAAEALSDEDYKVHVKWSKIKDKGGRTYQRCYGPPFLLQISGSGLVAPCGMMFNERYKKYHMGNITKQRFKDIIYGDRYWQVVNYLKSEKFNAQKMCGSLCLQHKVNELLDNEVKTGKEYLAIGNKPQHLNFI